jgi:hypothetical protein
MWAANPVVVAVAGLAVVGHLSDREELWVAVEVEGPENDPDLVSHVLAGRNSQVEEDHMERSQDRDQNHQVRPAGVDQSLDRTAEDSGEDSRTVVGSLVVGKVILVGLAVGPAAAEVLDRASTSSVINELAER